MSAELDYARTMTKVTGALRRATGELEPLLDALEAITVALREAHAAIEAMPAAASPEGPEK